MFVTGASKALALEQKVAPTATVIEGVVEAVDPALVVPIDTFNAVVTTVVSVEQIATAVGAGTGTGAQKLTAAIPQVEAAILANPLFAGKTAADLTLFNTAVSGLTSAVADLLSAFPATTTPATTTAVAAA